MYENITGGITKPYAPKESLQFSAQDVTLVMTNYIKSTPLFR